MWKTNINKILVVLCAVLLALAWNFYYQSQLLQSKIVRMEQVPDVELKNNLAFYENGTAHGELTGFVAFYSTEEQPKGVRQYVNISATDEFLLDHQVFYLTDIVKMSSLAPRFFDPNILLVESVHGSTVTLSDGHQNYFYLDKDTKEVRMLDAGGGMAKLITNDSDFRKFIKSFLKGEIAPFDNLK